MPAVRWITPGDHTAGPACVTRSAAVGTGCRPVRRGQAARQRARFWKRVGWSSTAAVISRRDAHHGQEVSQREYRTT